MVELISETYIGIMPATITINIPTKPHYRKFLQKSFSTHIKLNDPLGVVVYSMLRKPHVDETIVSKDERYPDHIAVEVSSRDLTRRYIRPGMSRLEVEQFNSFIEGLFKQRLFIYVNMMVSFGSERIVAIEKFMSEFDIHESDITCDALKKAEYRYRVSQEKLAANCPANNSCFLSREVSSIIPVNH